MTDRQTKNLGGHAPRVASTEKTLIESNTPETGSSQPYTSRRAPEYQYPATSRTRVLENIQRSMYSMAEIMKALLQNEDNCDYDRAVNDSGDESASTSQKRVRPKSDKSDESSVEAESDSSSSDEDDKPMKRKKRLKVGLPETTKIDEETDPKKAPKKNPVRMTGGNSQKMRPAVF